MPLQPATRLGPYEILAPLGAGGMGEVYRARDTRLGRELALKVLLEAHRLDPAALERFEQEARAASALNHPNIVTIYDIGRALIDGLEVSYIAMELVEGRSLRQVLGEGPLPIRNLTALAVPLSDALAAAHTKGIVHRDLKPENIMVTPEGRPKILDFGLAKLEAAPLGDQATLSEKARTRVGTILGTAGYMSPQQARGEVVDFRSDQFSLGAILYEMATGKRAFHGSSAIETLAAVLRDEPDSVGQLNPQVPPPLEWAIERCLAKDPDRRYASSRDLARDLEIVRDHLAQAPRETRASRGVNLPAERTPLIGRDREAALARQLLLRADVRLVTLTGPGGTGKTRLAQRVAAESAAQFPGGVLFVGLASITDPALAPAAIAQALGVRETGDRPLLAAMKDHLSQSPPVLLVLDNFEHLLAAASQVADLLAAGPALKVLVTSRAVLHVYGEHEFPVPPLGLPQRGGHATLETLAQYPAIALFVDRATAAKPDFALTRDNAAAVSEICARLDGLPLAIELAAARVRMLPPAALLVRLQSRLQVLTGGARDLPARQQTLRGTIEWSHQLLSPAEQKLFRRLAVFAGGCTLEAAEAVANAREDLDADLLEAVGSLVDQSLVQQVDRGDSEARFLMLETIREYGLERLAEAGEVAAIRRAHAAYCVVLAEEGASYQQPAEQAPWMNRFDLEIDNFRGALEWLTQNQEVDWGLRLGAALYRFWDQRNHVVEGFERLAAILKLQPAPPTKTRARALFVAAGFAVLLGHTSASRALHREGLEIHRRLGDHRGEAVSLNALGFNEQMEGNYSEACRLFQECLDLLRQRELEEPDAIAGALSNLAGASQALADYGQASALHQESIAILRALGNHSGVANALSRLGDLDRDRGDHASAWVYYQQSLEAYRELGDRHREATLLVDLSSLASGQGDSSTAYQLLGQSLEVFRELQYERGIALVLDQFAGLAAGQEKPEPALRLAGAAAAMRKALGLELFPIDRAKLERSLEPARQKLSPAAAARAWTEGWTMSPEAIQETLAFPSRDR